MENLLFMLKSYQWSLLYYFLVSIIRYIIQIYKNLVLYYYI